MIDFLKKAFGTREVYRFPGPDGSVMHAELKIGNSIVMLGEAGKEHPAMPTSLYLYFKDVDAVYKKALDAGGRFGHELIQQPVNRRAKRFHEVVN